MRKIEIKEIEPLIIFEGTQYPAGTWLVTNGFVAKEPGYFVYYDVEERIEVEAAGVISHYTADRLLHNWPDVVSEVEPPKAEPPKAKRKRKAKKG